MLEFYIEAFTFIHHFLLLSILDDRKGSVHWHSFKGTLAFVDGQALSSIVPCKGDAAALALLVFVGVTIILVEREGCISTWIDMEFNRSIAS